LNGSFETARTLRERTFRGRNDRRISRRSAKNCKRSLDSRQTCLYHCHVPDTKVTSEPRRRLLEAADRLFYQEGIRSVGIDRIIAEAGVAKMTLYSHFPSKDDLILAVLENREARIGEFFRKAIHRHGRKGKDKLAAFFAALKEWFQSPEFRGCAFINATIELADPQHPGSKFARCQKERFNGMLRELIADSLGKEATRFLPAVSLLVEGAIVTAQVQGHPGAADVARDAARRLLESGRAA
jgi:AcrR family transcriptional regulator